MCPQATQEGQTALSEEKKSVQRNKTQKQDTNLPQREITRKQLSKEPPQELNKDIVQLEITENRRNTFSSAFRILGKVQKYQYRGSTESELKTLKKNNSTGYYYPKEGIRIHKKEDNTIVLVTSKNFSGEILLDFDDVQYKIILNREMKSAILSKSPTLESKTEKKKELKTWQEIVKANPITDEKHFAKVLAESNERSILIDFWNENCMHCLESLPNLNAAAAKLGVKLYTVDTNTKDGRMISERNRIMMYPALAIFKNSQTIAPQGKASVLEGKLPDIDSYEEYIKASLAESK